MAEVKGKFITLACDLIKSKPEVRQAAMDSVRRKTGKGPYELDPEAWFDTEVFQAVFDAINANTDGVMGWASIKVIGQLVYPTIRSSVGLPPNLITPLDFIRFEAEGFMQNHRGPDLIPRRFVKTDDREVVVAAPSPGYDCALIEGVYEGILHMCKVDGRAKQIQCVKRGDSSCVYRITWSEEAYGVGAVDWSVYKGN